jgi:hypothetical protein
MADDRIRFNPPGSLLTPNLQLLHIICRMNTGELLRRCGFPCRADRSIGPAGFPELGVQASNPLNTFGMIARVMLCERVVNVKQHLVCRNALGSAE